MTSWLDPLALATEWTMQPEREVWKPPMVTISQTSSRSMPWALGAMSHDDVQGFAFGHHFAVARQTFVNSPLTRMSSVQRVFGEAPTDCRSPPGLRAWRRVTGRYHGSLYLAIIPQNDGQPTGPPECPPYEWFRPETTSSRTQTRTNIMEMILLLLFHRSTSEGHSAQVWTALA